jgi:cation diffusion facilitator CzcD-associated flavoprotein CzcO
MVYNDDRENPITEQLGRFKVNEILDVVVIGAGQAGLGISYFLQKARYSYVVLERNRVGETWRSQRWDSFALNTPNWSNGLPGMPYEGSQPDGFLLRDELVAFFEQYVHHFELAIQEGVTVTAVEQTNDGQHFAIHARDSLAKDGNETAINLLARNVVVASGYPSTSYGHISQSGSVAGRGRVGGGRRAIRMSNC